MKKRYHEISYYVPFIMVFLLIILWSLFNIFKEDDEPELIKVSVIVEESNNPRWTNFKIGLETAAKKECVDLNIVSTTGFSENAEEWNLVDQSVQDDTDGIILSPYDGNGFDEFYEELVKNQSLCFVNSTIRQDEISNQILSVVPDYEKIAQEILNQIREDYKDDLMERTVYLLTAHSHEYGISVAMELVEKELAGEGCNIRAIAHDLNEAKLLLESMRKDSIIIAFDDDSLLLSAKELASAANQSSSLYGIGISESCVYYLDTGVITGMTVVDDFNMGYESLLAVVRNIRNKYEAKVSVVVNSYTIRSEDVHKPEMEALLFPVIQ